MGAVMEAKAVSPVGKLVGELEQAITLLKKIDEAGVDVETVNATVHLFSCSPAQLASVVRLMGKASKHDAGSTFWIKQTFGTVGGLAFARDREVGVREGRHGHQRGAGAGRSGVHGGDRGMDLSAATGR